jgi:hypothetical protein
MVKGAAPGAGRWRVSHGRQRERRVRVVAVGCVSEVFEGVVEDVRGGGCSG